VEGLSDPNLATESTPDMQEAKVLVSLGTPAVILWVLTYQIYLLQPTAYNQPRGTW